MNLAEANRILRLSDSQLAIVRQAAVPLSPSPTSTCGWRPLAGIGISSPR